MIKLALIGKNIQHSQSPDLYRRLLSEEVEYDLLDYQDEISIPKASELLSKYRGINITSPYKKHFLTEVELTKNAIRLNAINCLGIKDGKIIGENTDYLAIIDILKEWLNQFQKLNVIVLGDGVMSKVTKFALEEMRLDYRVFSRRTIPNFAQLNLKEVFEKEFNQFNQELVINTCSREFIFKGMIDTKTIFWDYNYNFSPHSSSLPSKVKHYVDGSLMLELQARHALAFWSI